MSARVLVVDDSREARFARRRALERAGFEVIEASTGADGIAAIDHRPAVVVLDVNLPDIHGVEVCRRLRAHPYGANVGILQVSAASTDSHSQASSLEGGADTFLVEPVDSNVLVAAVRALLRLHAAEEAAREANRRLGLAQRAASSGVWDYDPRADRLWWSREALDVLGLEAGAQPQVPEWLEMLDHRDRDEIATALTEALAHGDRWDHEYRVATPGGARWLHAIGSIDRDAEGEATQLAGIVVDVTNRRGAEHRLHALQRVTAEMSGALTSDDVIVAGMAAAREVLGTDAAASGLLSAEGGTVRTRFLGVPAAIVETISSMPLDRSLPGPACMLDGVPVTYATRAERIRAFPHSDRDGAMPLETVAWAPIIGSAGPLGFLGVFSRASRRMSADDIALLLAIAQLCAQALERARLYEQEAVARDAAERAAWRSDLLAAVTEALEEERDFASRLQRLLHTIVPQLGDFATVEALRPDGRLEVLAVHHVDPDLVDALRELRERHHLDTEGAIGVGKVIRSGIPDLLEVMPAAVAHEIGSDPAGRRMLEQIAPRSYMAVPLETHEGPIGALMLGTSTSGRSYTLRDLDVADELAARISLVLENARLFDEQQRIARTLQLGLLSGASTAVAGITLALRYEPGAGGAQIGGDWYDAFDREDGTVVIAVGDVVGRGLRAATAMAKLRTALHAFAMVLDGPGAILGELDRFAQTVQGAAMTTVACAVLDPETGEARLAAAGHPPPLLVHPDGTAETIMDGRSPPLLGEVGPRPETTITVPHGATLALYSDGMIERRNEALDEGIGRLREAAAARAEDPVGVLADRLLETMLGTGSDDDAALLLLRREDPATPVLFRRVEADPTMLAPLRAAMRGWMAEAGIAGADARDLLLACSEACNNAVEHAYGPGTGGDLCLEARVLDGEAHVSIRDFGRWRPPAASGDRGRGADLIRTLCDTVEVAPTRTGTMVWMRRRLGAGTPA